MLKRKGLVVTALILLLVVSIVLPGCTAQQVSKEENVIKIGASVPLTGSLAKEGKYTQDGYKFWEDTVNAAGGIKVGDKQYKVQIVMYDDKSDSQTSAKLTEKLITEDKVNFMLSPYSSGLVMATSSIAEKYKMINIAPTANSDSIYTRGYKYIFGVLPRATNNLVGALSMIDEYKLPVKTVAIATPDSQFPIFAAEGVKALAESLGIQVVLFQKYPDKVTDLSPLISEIKNVNPDAIFCSGYFEDAILMVKQLKEQKLTPKLIAFTGPPTLTDFTKTLQEDAEGVIGHAWWAPATNWTGPVFGSAKDYAKNFEEKNGYVPPYHSAAASASGLVLQLAIEKAGSLDTEKILSTMSSMDVETFFMPIKFGKVDGLENINIGGKAIPMQIQNGATVVVYPEQIKETDPIFPLVPWDNR
ncbi:MAG TPA: amino acid ABC transporter substrate-binding protein [Clostridia bacterium]|nr:amino acid ABC transporter substrate-binding protein [Clostridia bacterium]